MNEYDAKKRLAQQGSQKLNSETAAPQRINGIPNSVLNDVFAGKRRATNEMMGHRVDPAPSVMARMSQAFGMDFSGVQVYRSDAMNGTGMHGMAQGNKVVLGSDVDLNTQEGQAILGHEFSHIRAQSMGIGGGSGLLQDAALEHQADNEGLLAARGMSISGEAMGMSTGLGMAGFEGITPLGGGLSANAAAPMQAYSNKDENKYQELLGKQNSGGLSKKELSKLENLRNARKGSGFQMIDDVKWAMDDDTILPLNCSDSDYQEAEPKQVNFISHGGTTDRTKMLDDNCKGKISNLNYEFRISDEKDENGDNKIRYIKGLNFKRVKGLMNSDLSTGYSDDDVLNMYEDLLYGYDKDDKFSNPEYDERRMQGIMTYKDMIYKKLQRIEKKYGKLLMQMHPDDIAERMGMKMSFNDSNFAQDVQQFSQPSNGEKMNQMLNFKDEEKEKDFKRLSDIFFGQLAMVPNIPMLRKSDRNNPYSPETATILTYRPLTTPAMMNQIKAGPSLSPKELQQYNKMVQKKIKSGQYMDYEKMLSDLNKPKK